MRRILVAGATGAVGRQLVPMLIDAGHVVTGTTRSPERAAWLRAVGADVALVDVFDRVTLRGVVVSTRPDVVIHQLTDLSSGFDARSLQRNARLRQVGTANLVAATLAAGASRFIAQSGAWTYAVGPLPHTERDPLRQPGGPGDLTLPGLLDLERLVTRTPGLQGIALRYGYLYGPGTVGDAPGDLPSVHVVAAARAAALAVDRGPAGIYNVVDDGELVSNRLARETLGWDPSDWS